MRVVLAAAGLKAGQEDYWIRQIAESRCEYLSGHGESPGQWYGIRAAGLGLAGVAENEQCHAIFEGKHPIIREQLAQPKWVADPRSKLPAEPVGRGNPDSRREQAFRTIRRCSSCCG
jgi:hypothetical protein